MVDTSLGNEALGGLDVRAVEDWLKREVEGVSGPLRAEKIAGGQSNPTFRLFTPDKTFVLRRKPPGTLLKSAHAVEREYRVQKALSGSDVPVPKMLALCEDDGVIGSAFYVMEHVTGRTFDDPCLEGVAPSERRSIYLEMIRVLAAIHSIDLEARGLTDYGPGHNYYRRQIDRWTKQYRASETEPIADMERLIEWLDAHAPEDDGRRSLVHGDFRIDNLLFARSGPDCVAVLDWELSTIGHPFADLAALIMQWGRPTGPEHRGLQGVDRAALGIPADDAVIAAYCEKTGLSGIENFGFYVAFCAFRMGAILQGVKKRALDGNASDPERGLQLGAYVPGFAADGLKAAGHG
ncbi:aminoglycoside phosphotransferase [Roseibium aquae]|uniref:Aminoglycoside phosphotransferase n=1 Tax=Roseibium aquae TaxID=1323746 RepID=A0A916X3C5_9HYPH|nr:phosphotransferase family protein [Roseibium aquae]GGB61156.1 aminoglycoside phosphotransferase [Roseibium aquae]